MPDLDDIPIVTVFGGAGYIGSVLTRLLLAEGLRVRVFENFVAIAMPAGVFTLRLNTGAHDFERFEFVAANTTIEHLFPARSGVKHPTA